MAAYQVCEWTSVADADGRGHRQVGREDPQRRVGARQPRVVLGVRGGALARLAHALHVDVDQAAQLADQEVDVHSRSAVHVRGVLAGQDRHLS